MLRFQNCLGLAVCNADMCKFEEGEFFLFSVTLFTLLKHTCHPSKEGDYKLISTVLY